jgi:membrane-bound metal-dependent hydrolase YbcI (DUF457 family)
MNRFVSTRTHAMIGYIVGLILIFAPNIFGFSDNGGAAVIIPRVVGIVLLLSELTTDSGLSLVGMIPMRMHLAMDVVAGLFLAVSPWLFRFNNQGANAWAPLLVAGLAYVGLSAVTRTAVESRRGRTGHQAAA